MARIAYQKAIAGIFESVLGAIGSGAASTASSGSYYSNMGGNGAGDGGYGMMMNYGGGRASGGSTTGGTLYEVAEGGRPELYQSGGRTYLLSGQNGNVVPAGRGGAAVAAGNAGMLEIVINITNKGQDVQAKQTGQRMDGKKMMVDLILETVSSDTAKGGRTAQAMQQRFGLQRRGVPVGS